MGPSHSSTDVWVSYLFQLLYGPCLLVKLLFLIHQLPFQLILQPLHGHHLTPNKQTGKVFKDGFCRLLAHHAHCTMGRLWPFVFILNVESHRQHWTHSLKVFAKHEYNIMCIQLRGNRVSRQSTGHDIEAHMRLLRKQNRSFGYSIYVHAMFCPKLPPISPEYIYMAH